MLLNVLLYAMAPVIFLKGDSVNPINSLLEALKRFKIKFFMHENLIISYQGHRDNPMNIFWSN